MKRISLSILAVVILGAGLLFLFYMNHRDVTSMQMPPGITPPSASAGSETTSPPGTSAASESAVTTAPAVNSLLPEDLDSILEATHSVPLDTIPGSYTALVNRNYLLPSTYAPSDLTEPRIRFSFAYRDDKRKLRKAAAAALEKMFRAAEKDKVILYGVSGYRSYARQEQIYNRNVASRGKNATDKISAKPGSSEHQTGLTIDISARSVGCQLSQTFGSTKEGKWVAKNAHKYGYIVRYPDGKSKVTGYHYEPWHIRFVGVTVATYLYKHKLTMEEYYNVSCDGNEENTGVDVEDPDKVKYATPKPKKKKKP